MGNRDLNRCRTEMIGFGVLAAALVLLGGLDAAVSAPPEPERPAPTTPPDIFGARNWQRSVKHAHTEARRLGMPLLVVSGSLPRPVVGSVDGSDIFDHPLIAEVAESYFIPVSLAAYGDGAMTRSVNINTRGTSSAGSIRVLSPPGDDLVAQRKTDFSARDLVLPLISALRQMNIEPPPYLLVTREEAMCHVRGVQRATFGMHCFWEGEVALGAIPGVVRTTPGHIGKREVVDLQFDPLRTSYKELIFLARSLKSASVVFAWDSDQFATAQRIVGDAAVRIDSTIQSVDGSKHHLAQTPLKHLPMTHLQAIRINAALAKKKDAMNLLSPRQLTLLALIEEHKEAGWPNSIDVDIRTAWPRAMQIAAQVTND